MAAYYNEIDPFAAAWLRQLIAAGHIAPGIVDERDIRDVRPRDLDGYAQYHFFAGIGVWSYALRRAGWPDARPVWTGSCPCQPFSPAGKGGGFADERHLWPALHWLIDNRRPDIVLGEQVASKDGLAWLDLVSADLEGTGYACGAVDTCAAGFGAPHIRQRLYWVAYADNTRPQGRLVGGDGAGERAAGARGVAGGVAHAHNSDEFGDARGCGARVHATDERGRRALQADSSCSPIGLADLYGEGRGAGREVRSIRAEHDAQHGGAASGLAHTNGRNAGPKRLQRSGEHGQQPQDGGTGRLADAGCEGRRQNAGSASSHEAAHGRAGWDGGEPDSNHLVGGNGANSRPGPTNGLWRDADWLHCRDGKWRPVEPGTFPLAHGAAARVGRLRGYGNALCLAQAVAFIAAVMETI